MKKISFLILCAMLALRAMAGDLKIEVNNTTGALSALRIGGDTNNMNWMLSTDGTQYAWITAQHGWGLGYFSLGNEHYRWEKPVSLSSNGMKATWEAGGLRISVRRTLKNGCLTEDYTFKNATHNDLSIKDMGILTPFNDNYPDAQTCMTQRCNTHIWAGGSAAYVLALRMDGQGKGLGLMLEQGEIDDYDIWERSGDKGMSNFRGVMALCPRDTLLRAGKSFHITWKVFTHNGQDDFYARLLNMGGVVAESPKYVYEVGETAHISLRSSAGVLQTKDITLGKPGSRHVVFNYGKDKTTHVDLLAVSSYEGLIRKRIDFILNHQQMNDPNDPRDGAYMVYDNEQEKIYLNNDWRRSPDTNDGRERVGMGVLLAKWQLLHPDNEIKQSLVRYAKFVRQQLQDDDYTTHSSFEHDYPRGYNYPWISEFYFLMHETTLDKQYALDGYHTMMAFFRNYHNGFYAIGMPVTNSLRILSRLGLNEQRDSLLAEYVRTADVFVEKGLNFPAHEVNYEQSIIAPAVQFLCEVYLETRNKKYLDTATTLLRALETFAGRQPSHHLNEISIRHWDGYWFGRRQILGDVFPHYWSTLNAAAFHYYAKCTGNKSYDRRAEQVVRDNLSLFTEDGRGSCAYLYPRMVNGEHAKYYDVFANDQDWALAFYLLVAHDR